MERKPVAPDQYTEQFSDLAGFICCSCAFTGHRPNKLPWRYDEDAPGCAALKRTLAEQIAALADNGYTHFLSGMALGVDCWCSQIVLDLRENNPTLKLHCLLPCEGQDAKWPASSQKRYHAILERADSIVYVNREYNDKCMLDAVRFSSVSSCWRRSQQHLYGALSMAWRFIPCYPASLFPHGAPRHGTCPCWRSFP